MSARRFIRQVWVTVIGVASVSQANEPSSFTNYGPDLVIMAAPGQGLVTTYLGSHYAAIWGTSFSTALVSGAAADPADATNNNTRHQQNRRGLRLPGVVLVRRKDRYGFIQSQRVENRSLGIFRITGVHLFHCAFVR